MKEVYEALETLHQDLDNAGEILVTDEKRLALIQSALDMNGLEITAYKIREEVYELSIDLKSKYTSVECQIIAAMYAMYSWEKSKATIIKVADALNDDYLSRLTKRLPRRVDHAFRRLVTDGFLYSGKGKGRERKYGLALSRYERSKFHGVGK